MIWFAIGEIICTIKDQLGWCWLYRHPSADDGIQRLILSIHPADIDCTINGAFRSGQRLMQMTRYRRIDIFCDLDFLIGVIQIHLVRVIDRTGELLAAAELNGRRDERNKMCNLLHKNHSFETVHLHIKDRRNAWMKND